MIEFIRNEKTGLLEAWKSGKKIGEIITMGDKIKKKENEYVGVNGKMI